ncbi:glycoside hydrolase family protein [Puniceicoccus vermicola]|uniref:Sucrase n=1 Tax=Puniceicoccus vermicola TaxID=388746 RepID=A0A7X1E777_9BACT|nr:glycoside hydrolase family protein [Puniceicoccus vermicola]MBC2603427.1 sucrase [Puniceicoccus vermicola]
MNSSNLNASPKPSQFATLFKRGPEAYGEDQCFREEGWHVWCGSILEDPKDGKFHLYYSRWPVSEGYDAWGTHSEIAHAVGDSLVGPFTYVETIFQREKNSSRWDAHCFHNVTVKAFGGRYFLYYMGNRGDGDWWNHRNNQRIGVAVADSPSGPWHRQSQPVIDVSPGAWDGLMVSNPTVADAGDGRFLMIYKGVAEGTMPFGGRVLHGLAWSDRPDGPFVKEPYPIFDYKNADFGFEDPFLWREGRSFYCLVKDMGGTLSPSGETELLLLQSEDGIHWSPSKPLQVLGRRLENRNGKTIAFERVERPHFFQDSRGTLTLLVAVKPEDPEEPSCNIRLVYR